MIHNFGSAQCLNYDTYACCGVGDKRAHPNPIWTKVMTMILTTIIRMQMHNNFSQTNEEVSLITPTQSKL